ncbi:MAG: F0F1 ATP synthase subunit delta [Clostridia bacterium]|nr:F0F1 ATP synthase subunit delta [Clostridia bacterium]
MTDVHVTVSRKLPDADREKIEAYLAAKYGEYRVVYHVDEQILGGLIIFDGHKVYDGSLRTKLQTLKQNG